MDGPLSGIRVLALENYLAGPVASMTMGDLGAEVIKIEPPGPRNRKERRCPKAAKARPMLPRPGPRRRGVREHC